MTRTIETRNGKDEMMNARMYYETHGSDLIVIAGPDSQFWHEDFDRRPLLSLERTEDGCFHMSDCNSRIDFDGDEDIEATRATWWDAVSDDGHEYSVDRDSNPWVVRQLDHAFAN